MRQVVIFSDEPGWHGKSLTRAMAEHDLRAQFVTLSDCRLALSESPGRIVVPGFDDLPDGAFVRGVAGGSLEEIVLRLDILHALEIVGIPVFNSGRAIERTVDKAMTSFLLYRRRIPSPRTWIAESTEHARAIAKKELALKRELVMKPLFGSQGNGVARVSSLEAFDTCEPTAGVFYLQEYIDSGESEYRDWRVFVIGGNAVAAMERRSSHWVTNRAQGAKCEPYKLDQILAGLAEAAASAVDVDYAGVDLLRDSSGNWLVSEVNGIPAWQGLQRVTGCDITQRLVSAFAAKINRDLGLAAAG